MIKDTKVVSEKSQATAEGAGINSTNFADSVSSTAATAMNAVAGVARSTKFNGEAIQDQGSDEDESGDGGDQRSDEDESGDGEVEIAEFNDVETSIGHLSEVEELSPRVVQMVRLRPVGRNL
ncbi:hypothetical protein PR003_g22407 [Phytophthora rubi]|uniref:Uncharacterized protein n=1 Tax=Phytophthora rubi TaxID=129364 RepID=A0A6A4D626_9STRA|nr:hypothetical protein PR002_g21702 [Phytophthora rubi]KAE8991463.1 hypothetical protein PR001_g21222 [Phytophthora rubi]KAE9301927.1 hypothetical protein PR003_g22407 [Phytophthora rubi]